MASPGSCGPHTELCSSETVRVTRCSCGTVHMTLLRSGVTVRMSTEAFRAVASGPEARPRGVQRLVVGEDLDAPAGRVADDFAFARPDEHGVTHREGA